MGPFDSVIRQVLTQRAQPVSDDTELDTDFSMWDKLDAQTREQQRQLDFENAVRRLQTHPGNETRHFAPMVRRDGA